MSIEEYKSKIEKLFNNIEIITVGGVRLDDSTLFEVSIGKRVVETEFISNGKVPVYSANVFRPFGYIDKLLITEFHVPSVLWGIDGDWQVNYIPEMNHFIQPIIVESYALRMRKNSSPLSGMGPE